METIKLNFTCYVDGGCDNATRSNAYGSYKITVGNESIAHKTFLLPEIETNNESEYASLIELLKAIRSYEGMVNGSTFTIYTDSLLMYNQLKGKWKVKAENLRPFHKRAKKLISRSKHIELVWTHRERIVKELGH